MFRTLKRASLALPLVALSLAGCGALSQEDGQTDPETTERQSSAITASGSVLTQHNDNARTGSYTVETTLTPSSVNSGSFGPIFRRRVQGNIVTQPLYASGLSTASGTKNGVIVATNTNMIYAFDADSTSPNETADMLWSSPLSLGATDLPSGTCSEIVWQQGIASTPAIDAATNMMYVVARRIVSGSVEQRLFKINLTNGTIAASVAISSAGASVPLAFDPSMHVNRPGLLLQGGNVYIGFATRQCDATPYAGWMFAYSMSTLTRQGVFTTASFMKAGAPLGNAMSGIWHSGSGLVGDGTFVYANTGNTARNNGSTLSNSVLKLAGSNLVLSASFKDGFDDRLNCGDTDLAAGGVVLAPGPAILSGGKQGVEHVINPSTMGAIQNAQVTYDTYHLPGQHPTNCFAAGHPVDPDDCFHNAFFGQDCVVRESDYPWSEHLGPNIHGVPALFMTGSTGMLFTFGEKDFLRGYPYSSTTRTLTCASGPMSCNSTLTSSTIRAPEGMPGGFLSVSSNGTANGIVWAMVERIDGQFLTTDGKNNYNISPSFGKKVTSWLIAANASNLAEIYRDQFEYPFVKFVPPTVANGKVFRATMSPTDMLANPQSYLIAYGPLKTQSRWAKVLPATTALLLQ